MKTTYTAIAALVLVATFLVGMTAADIIHASDYANGWQDGYSASEVSNQLATQRQVAAGLCRYAAVACKGNGK